MSEIDLPRWLWITPEIRPAEATGALVYSMGLARAVAATPVEMTMVGIGGAAVDIEGIDVDLVSGSLRGGGRSLLSPLPNLAFATRIARFVERVETLLRREWDVVVVDGLQVAWASELAATRSTGAVVYIAHNHEASLRREVAAQAEWKNGQRAALTVDAAKAARLERRSIASADLTTSITEADRKRFASEVPDAEFVTITPGWSGAPAADGESPMGERPRRVAMLGSLEWHVKQENLRRFVTAADPIFAEAGIELVVGGRAPDDFRSAIERDASALTMAGWVEDPAEFLASCRIGLVAEPLGGGFKLKALDYVFHGVALACLSGNAAGLPVVAGESMIEGASLVELAHAVVRAIDDDVALMQMVAEARAVCGPAFSWDQRARVLIEAVASTRKSQP